MDTNRILDELKVERDRIDRAIVALEAIDSTARQQVHSPRVARERRTVSTAARGRMAAAQRARRAKEKRAQPVTPARRMSTARTRRGRLSAAARRKLSRLLKQRWAQGKMGRRAKAA